MTRTMTGVVLTGHGGLDKLEWCNDLPRPSPKRGEVLIRVHASAVNNTDVNTRLAWYSKSGAGAEDATWTGQPLRFPHIQGIDCVGVIEEVGAGVPAGRVGQRVMVEPCLREVAGERKSPPWFLGSECPGAFADYLCVAGRHAHQVDSPLSDTELATFPCSYSTAENMLVRCGARAGDRAIVTGASGGVGSAAIQLLRARGARVVAVSSPAKFDRLKALGADEVISRDDDPVAGFGTGGFDIAVDLAGGPMASRLIEALAPGGRYAVAGAVAGAEARFDLRSIYLKDLTLFGCTALDDGVFAGLVSRIETGQIKPLLANTFALRDIRAAQTLFLERGHVGKIGLRVAPET